MKVIIAGSRHITDYEHLQAALQRWYEEGHPAMTEVVCGTAPGVDTLGQRWAARINVPIKLFPADWAKHGKAAGPLRNAEMARYADALILVWDGQSKGSADMKRRATEHNLPIVEHIVTPTSR